MEIIGKIEAKYFFLNGKFENGTGIPEFINDLLDSNSLVQAQNQVITHYFVEGLGDLWIGEGSGAQMLYLNKGEFLKFDFLRERGLIVEKDPERYRAKLSNEPVCIMYLFPENVIEGITFSRAYEEAFANAERAGELDLLCDRIPEGYVKMLLANLEGKTSRDYHSYMNREDALRKLIEKFDQDFGYEGAKWRKWLEENDFISSKDSISDWE